MMTEEVEEVEEVEEGRIIWSKISPKNPPRIVTAKPQM